MFLELEKFDGVVIFIINLFLNYDEVFKRRIFVSVEFKLLDEEGRKIIFKIYILEKLLLGDDVSISKLVKEFDNVLGVDIKDIIFMVVIIVLERDFEIVSMEDFKELYKDIKNRYKEV